MLRPIIAATMLGAVVGSFLAAGVLFARTEDLSSTVSIDNFTFSPKELKVKAGTTVTWTNHDDIPHGIASSNNAFAKSKALDTDDSYSFKFTGRGATNTSVIYTPTWWARSSWKRQRAVTPRNNATIGSTGSLTADA
jgi:plastocyanin